MSDTNFTIKNFEPDVDIFYEEEIVFKKNYGKWKNNKIKKYYNYHTSIARYNNFIFKVKFILFLHLFIFICGLCLFYIASIIKYNKNEKLEFDDFIIIGFGLICISIAFISFFFYTVFTLYFFNKSLDIFASSDKYQKIKKKFNDLNYLKTFDKTELKTYYKMTFINKENYKIALNMLKKQNV